MSFLPQTTAFLAGLYFFPKRKRLVTLVYLFLAFKKYIAAKRSVIKHNIPELPLIGSDTRTLIWLKDSYPLTVYKHSKLCNFQNYEYHFPLIDVLMIHDENDRKHVLKTNWKNYPKNVDGRGFGAWLGEILGQGIFASDGKEWINHRKSASHMFSTNALRGKMETVFVQHSERLVEILEENIRSNAVFDMQNVMASFTFDTICEIAFGVNPEALEAASKGNKSGFLNAFDQAQVATTRRISDPDPVWQLRRFLGIGHERDLPAHVAFVENYVYNIIDARLAEFKNGDQSTRNDLLSLYIRHAQTNDQPHMLERDYLKDVVLNFMLAGRDTTSCSMTNMFRLLATNPEAEQKLAKELQSKAATMDGLMEDTPFADACFNEALRMFPPVATDLRMVSGPDVLPSGARVERGWIIVIPNYSIGRNPNYWTDPDKYIPDRWLEWDDGAHLRKIPEYKFPVFWGGPRICLGKEMARLEAKLVMKHVMGKITVLPTGDVKDEYINGPIMFYKHGLPCRARYR